MDPVAQAAALAAGIAPELVTRATDTYQDWHSFHFAWRVSLPARETSLLRAVHQASERARGLDPATVRAEIADLTLRAALRPEGPTA